MLCTRVLLIVLITLAPMHVAAGGWARGQGQSFISVSHSRSTTQTALAFGDTGTDGYTMLYIEYGITDHLTFGLDAGESATSHQTVAFLRYTLTDPSDRTQISFDLGGGDRAYEFTPEMTLLRFGLSAGRGLSAEGLAWLPIITLQGGWLGLEAIALYDRTHDTLDWTFEATLGLALTDRDKLILQVLHSDVAGADRALTITSSYVRDFWGHTSVRLASQFGLGGTDHIGVEVGIWRRF
jgi:hypothetical protein